jgi:hypothetical protein
VEVLLPCPYLSSKMSCQGLHARKLAALTKDIALHKGASSLHLCLHKSSWKSFRFLKVGSLRISRGEIKNQGRACEQLRNVGSIGGSF